MKNNKEVKRERLTAQIPREIIERARNAVYWTPGLTLAGLTEIAIEKLLDELEEKQGKPFPQRPTELKAGRPVKC